MAGGLVLGVGAAVTLAAWNDSEFAQGTFTAGSFNVQGSNNGTDYADHEAAGGGLKLTFGNVTDNLSANETVYASYWLRLAKGSTTGGTLQPAGVTVAEAAGVSDNADAISYVINQVPAGGSCGPGVGTQVASGTDLRSQTAGTVRGVPLVAGANGAEGPAVQLCIAVTAGDETAFDQGLSTTATWQFDAVSG
ncbi:hypothetical protein D477_010366 [Arthrobacter crystallopoietes BAB-32]|uniref:SipW-cognate class signal peptide n=1 Tax=Arthrobacter crystallopoietes BAB-32 TaxID=1246476 RepID=N1V2U8_9MICC|nr:hypothetical protein D477_010366 [Arthrobacter crystallopoietes BAB-32]